MNKKQKREISERFADTVMRYKLANELSLDHFAEKLGVPRQSVQYRLNSPNFLFDFELLELFADEFNCVFAYKSNSGRTKVSITPQNDNQG